MMYSYNTIVKIYFKVKFILKMMILKNQTLNFLLFEKFKTKINVYLIWWNFC